MSVLLHLRIQLLALLLAACTSFAAEPVVLEQGRTYRTLEKTAPTPPDRVEAILFYRYGDSAMAEVMPAWEAWRGSAGPFTVLTSTPGVLVDEDGVGARVFLALARSGVGDDLAPRIVSAAAAGAIVPSDFSSWGRWLGDQGVNVEELVKAVNDPLIRQQTGNIPQVMQMHEVSSLPAIVVAGRYLVDTTLVSPRDLIPTAKAIAARLQSAR